MAKARNAAGNIAARDTRGAISRIGSDASQVRIQIGCSPVPNNQQRAESAVATTARRACFGLKCMKKYTVYGRGWFTVVSESDRRSTVVHSLVRRNDGGGP